MQRTYAGLGIQKVREANLVLLSIHLFWACLSDVLYRMHRGLSYRYRSLFNENLFQSGYDPSSKIWGRHSRLIREDTRRGNPLRADHRVLEEIEPGAERKPRMDFFCAGIFLTQRRHHCLRWFSSSYPLLPLKHGLPTLSNLLCPQTWSRMEIPQKQHRQENSNISSSSANGGLKG